VLKNNERLANHAKTDPSAPPLEDVQDQGFTRPSVLILLPFRNSALAWVDALTSHTPAPMFQVQNHTRFRAEFGIPDSAEDKLRESAPGTYPEDHVENFSGNVDDSFRVGIKVTKKSIKLFSEFYGSDIVLASPLGLRMSIEKEGYVFLHIFEIENRLTTTPQERGLPLLYRDGHHGSVGRLDHAKLGPCSGNVILLE
jgi:U3 small nucleolar RNA-associated protein 25